MFTAQKTNSLLYRFLFVCKIELLSCMASKRVVDHFKLDSENIRRSFERRYIQEIAALSNKSLKLFLCSTLVKYYVNFAECLVHRRVLL